MVDGEYEEQKELTYFNPFAKKINALRNRSTSSEEFLNLLTDMGDYIGKLEARISKVVNKRDE